MRTCLCTLAVGLVLVGLTGCSTQRTPAASTPPTDIPTSANADGSIRFWAADSLGAVCFDRQRTTHALLARARAREQGRDAIANVPTTAR